MEAYQNFSLENVQVGFCVRDLRRFRLKKKITCFTYEDVKVIRENFPAKLMFEKSFGFNTDGLTYENIVSNSSSITIDSFRNKSALIMSSVFSYAHANIVGKIEHANDADIIEYVYSSVDTQIKNEQYDGTKLGAIKIKLKKSYKSNNIAKKQRLIFINNLRIFNVIRHPNIVFNRKAFETENYYYQITEFVGNIGLNSILENITSQNHILSLKRYYSLQFVLALEYLHNCLITPEERITKNFFLVDYRGYLKIVYLFLHQHKCVDHEFHSKCETNFKQKRQILYFLSGCQKKCQISQSFSKFF